jgi:RimJ/RimL family protein N-acetyltransferase
MHTDSEVRRYAGGRAWSVDEAKGRFQEQYLGKPRDTYGLWAALSGSRSAARLGLYIARPYWRRRLATEAATALVEFGFHKLQLARILADTDKDNVASGRILAKLGFNVVRDETLRTGRVITHYELRR